MRYDIHKFGANGALFGALFLPTAATHSTHFDLTQTFRWRFSEETSRNRYKGSRRLPTEAPPNGSKV